MLIVFILYLALLMVITIYTARMSKSSSDFISGGRKIGGISLALSERATGESAWLILGLTGEAFLIGIQAIWYAIGCVAGIFFIWFVMGNRLREESEKTGALTITSLISRKFPGAEKAIGTISSLIIIFFLLFYITAQFYGGGKVLFDTFGINQTWGIVIGSLIVVFYCMIGGFITVVATDVFQAVLMIISLIVMPVILLFIISSHNIEIAQGLQKAGAAYVSSTGGKTGISAFMLIISGISWALGYTGQPQLLTRMMVLKNKRDYNKAKWVAGIWTLFAYAGALMIGFIGIVFVQEGLIGGDAATRLAAEKGNELIFPVMVNAFMLPVIAGFLLSGAISAMMSTASSEIILTSSAITEDIHGNFAKKKMSPKKELWFNRIITLLVGLVAFFFALDPGDSIFKMVSYAWSGIGSSFGPALLLVLFWKKVSRAGVIASLVSGTVGTIIWKEFFEATTQVSERLTSFIFAFAMAVIFSLMFPEKNKLKN
ncbi:MAG TPA: sodium/proline symporter [Bacteroidales bacterium]|nr:sodium/proline symporter [Bacteroidales bacterium]HPS18459.1 sodium/proline symporter [Bacteroidales bacterium]